MLKIRVLESMDWGWGDATFGAEMREETRVQPKGNKLIILWIIYL